VGIEPVAMSAAAAADFLGDPSRIYQASAESLPLDNGSQRLVLMESVLEHVDSPILSLSEAYRVLEPNGVLYVITTNKLQFSITGKNAESKAKFYNWFPDLVKECYVHKHLHFEPTLANYSVRPAVHWFTFAGLCNLGRQVGFAKFYSKIDLADGPGRSKSAIKRWLFEKAKYNPWLRALALTKVGGTIFMMKRPEE
jgi:ubiquinone/menaquinone biosynthesis C-methylase UbiE